MKQLQCGTCHWTFDCKEKCYQCPNWLVNIDEDMDTITGKLEGCYCPKCCSGEIEESIYD